MARIEINNEHVGFEIYITSDKLVEIWDQFLNGEFQGYQELE